MKCIKNSTENMRNDVRVERVSNRSFHHNYETHFFKNFVIVHELMVMQVPYKGKMQRTAYQSWSCTNLEITKQNIFSDFVINN